MDQEKIGQFIKELRKENNLTQKEFADILGVTFQSVSKWETGKSIPDILILKDISKRYNVNIDELINGEKKEQEKTNKKILIIIPIILIFLLLIIILLIFNNSTSNFTFKTISSKCSDYNITGSAAYNKDKASIYISSIEFCGKDDNKIYKSIECTLYEKNKNNNIKITTCNKEKNITITDYLKKIKINVNNYKRSCRKINSTTLYIEIKTTNQNNKTNTHKVPITLKDNC